MKSFTIFAAALLISLGSAGFSSADVLTVSASQAVVLPAGEGGVSRVAFQFDLSALRSGEGRRIDIATISWPVSGIPDDLVTEYTLYPVSALWSAEAVSEEEQVVAVSNSSAASWEITPQEHEAGLGGQVRFDVTSLVADWAGGEASNYGVVVTTTAVSGNALGPQLSGATLTIRYGFVEE